MRYSLLFTLATCVFLSTAPACIHPPSAYPGKLGSKIQEYLFFKEGPDIHLIMNQRIQSNIPLPDELAWVTPLPSVPTRYLQEKDDAFEILFRATEPVRRSRVKSLSSPSGFIAHDTVHVGNYEIIPIEVVDTKSGSEINQWLQKNGYARVPYAGLRYYLKPKACFLAIKVRGMIGKESVLHPLHVVYRAEAARLPLKFFAKAGKFDVFVYVKNPGPAFVPQPGLEKLGIVPTGSAVADSSLAGRSGITGFAPDSASIQRFQGQQLNAFWNRLSRMKEDPLIELK